MQASPQPAVRQSRARLVRAGFRALGAVALALGAIGIVAPLLPTTVFWIAAVACFLRSDPRLAGKLLNHPTVGPALRAWFEHGAISRTGKICASLGLAAGWGATAIALREAVPTAIALLPFALVAAFLWTRPLPRAPQAESEATEA